MNPILNPRPGFALQTPATPLERGASFANELIGASICKRCLLSEIDDKAQAAHIYEYIASLPEELKADAALIHNRLDKCRTCDNLVNGMCRVCGCYVEVRAAKIMQSCPDVYPKW